MLLYPDRNGYVHLVDRATGEVLSADPFVFVLQMNALGLLPTFAPDAWYPTGEPAPWGLTPLEDQQLAALVMRMIGGMVYAGAAIAMVARWLSPRPAVP